MSIVAGEIDIDIPDINLGKIELFLSDTIHIHTNSKMSSEEKIYKQRNNRPYPWDRRVLEYLGTPTYDFNKYPEFKKIFNVVNCLPIDVNTRTCLMLYQNSQKSYDFNWHFDGDNDYGFRVCFNLDTAVPFVELAKLDKKFEYVNKTFERIQQHMVDETTKIQLYPTRKNTIFLFNRLNYPHRVPMINSNVNRCVIIVHGKIIDLNLKFIQKIEDEFHIQ